MAIKKIIALFCAIFVFMFIFGCAMGSQNTGNAGSGGNLSTGGISKNINGDGGNGIFRVDGGTSFLPQGNPLFNIRNSSDPAMCVYHLPTINKDVLMMVTSCDLENVESLKPKETYPMNTTYLYTTSNLDGKWYDHGAVLQENDLSENTGGWSKPDANHLWAPDIQYVPELNKFYLYVPDIDANGIQHIGIATAGVDSSTSTSICSKFTVQKSSFYIWQGNSTRPHGDYAYDPGVFYDNTTASYYMSYCDYGYTGSDPATDPDGRIRIAKMDRVNRGGVVDMTQATDIGQIQFQNPIDPVSWYDLNSQIYMEGPDICKFTINGIPRYYLIFAAKVPGTGTERIGYATASETDFTTYGPDKCWTFKGWIMSKVNGQEDSGDFWTNHADLGTFNGKYYIFYHKIVKDSTNYPGSVNRQVCIDEITFNRSTGDIILPLLGSSDGDGTNNGPFVKRLLNDNTGRYLTGTSKYDDPAAVCQTTHDEWTSQQWTIETVADDVISLKNNWSGLYLNMVGMPQLDLTFVTCREKSIVSTTSAVSQRQQWQEIILADGNVMLRNVYSGNYLTLADTIDGASAICQPLGGDWGNPKWKWTIINGNRLRNALTDKKDLTCTGTYGGSVKAQYLNMDWTCQKWALEVIKNDNDVLVLKLRNLWSGRYLYEYNGTAITHSEGVLSNNLWRYSTTLTNGRAILYNNASGNPFLTVTSGSGNLDYDNVECRTGTSASKFWYFK